LERQNLLDRLQLGMTTYEDINYAGDWHFWRGNNSYVGDDRNERITMLRALIAPAIEDGVIATDPTAGIKRPKLSREGWHSWSEDEIAQYETKHPIGSQARLSFALALFTCQRSADLIRMGKQHVSGGKIALKQQKTGAALKIKMHPDLVAILAATPSDHLTFLVSEWNKPYKNANSFGHRMRLWAREAGLTDCPLQGLRKASCRRLAEAGCTAHEIMAISGHKSLAEVERYTRAVEQERMAEKAISRTTTTHTAGTHYPHEKKA